MLPLQSIPLPTRVVPAMQKVDKVKHFTNSDFQTISAMVTDVVPKWGESREGPQEISSEFSFHHLERILVPAWPVCVWISVPLFHSTGARIRSWFKNKIKSEACGHDPSLALFPLNVREQFPHHLYLSSLSFYECISQQWISNSIITLVIVSNWNHHCIIYKGSNHFMHDVNCSYVYKDITDSLSSEGFTFW